MCMHHIFLSTTWFSWIILQWTWEYKYLFYTLFSILLEKYTKLWLLYYLLVLFLIIWGKSTVSCSSCTILQLHQQNTKVPINPKSCWLLLYSFLKNNGDCIRYEIISYDFDLNFLNDSVQFSHSVVSHSLQSYEQQHARLPCPFPTAGVDPNPCPLSPSNHLILCHPLLLLSSIFPRIRVFSNESALLIRWPRYLSFSFNISPSNEHPGLIFRMDWLDLLAIQGTLKSLLQYHSWKVSILISRRAT